MTESAPKTTATALGVQDFITAIADDQQRDDAIILSAMMARISGHPPTLWGASIIGFGQYHYRYDSGHSGSMCRIGFSPRTGKMVVYLVDGHSDHSAMLARLGTHKTGKSCLYIKRLADIDLTVLEEIVRASLSHVAQKYPQ